MSIGGGPGPGAYYPTVPGVGSTYEAHAGYRRPDAMLSLGAMWFYNWGPQPQTYTAQLEAVPMLWSAGHVGKPVGGNSRWLMLFNEPENAGQANMTPQDAARLTKEVTAQYSLRKILSPACIWPVWLDTYLQWLPKVGAPMPDAIAAHCYARGQDAPDMLPKHIESFMHRARAYGIPEVWVTEWAYVSDDFTVEGYDKAQRFIADTIAWFDTQEMITKHAYFQASYGGGESWGWGEKRNTSLVDWNTGALTPLGVAYRDAVKGTQPPPPEPQKPDPLPSDVDRDGDVDIDDIRKVVDDYGKGA